MPERTPALLTHVAGRRWRDYETPAGARPVRDFISGLSDADAAEVAAAMTEVKRDGLRAARHLGGDIYEVRANGSDQAFRILFSAEGRRGRILLALERLLQEGSEDPRSSDQGGRTASCGLAGARTEAGPLAGRQGRNGIADISFAIYRSHASDDRGGQVAIRMADQDFLDEVINERTAANPAFPAMVDLALKRRKLLGTLAAIRERRGLSQTVVADRMKTSQSAVARLEAGDCDARLSTVDRYAAALGMRIEWDLRALEVEPAGRQKRRARRLGTK